MTAAWSMRRKWLITTALAAGVAVGAYGIAGAATSTTTNGSTTPTTSASNRSEGNEDSAHEKSESAEREAAEKAGNFGAGHRGGPETVVTGAAAAKIKAAALAAVPGTVDKTEQRADGSYESEMTKADGSE